uniref:Uncharacterized protein n=1 Tax=Anguilla anguilla TaxID=7936 RepID=A0A0E9W875_ANGAN
MGTVRSLCSCDYWEQNGKPKRPKNERRNKKQN